MREIVQRFRRYYFGDSLLKAIHLDTAAFTVSFQLDRATLLRDRPHVTLADKEAVFSPAILTFTECRQIRLPQAVYAFNNTMVEFSATEQADGTVAFRFALTGGWDNETFWSEILIVARDFSVRQG